jgi:hypothetical protein
MPLKAPPPAFQPSWPCTLLNQIQQCQPAAQTPAAQPQTWLQRLRCCCCCWWSQAVVLAPAAAPLRACSLAGWKAAGRRTCTVGVQETCCSGRRRDSQQRMQTGRCSSCCCNRSCQLQKQYCVAAHAWRLTLAHYLISACLLCMWSTGKHPGKAAGVLAHVPAACHKLCATAHTVLHTCATPRAPPPASC